MTTGRRHVSMGEIEFVVTRAAFGVGAPFGIAEDFAYAVQAAARFGIDPMPAALACLSHLDREPGSRQLTVAECGTEVILSGPSRLSAVFTGPSLSDFGHLPQFRKTVIRALNVDHPLLVAAAQVSGRMKNCIIEWPDAQVILDEQRVIQLNFTDEDRLQAPGPVNLKIRSAVPDTIAYNDSRRRFDAATLETEARRIACEGVLVDTDAWAGLVEFFNRCLVPSSEQSLLDGAGAGLVDRD